MDDEARSRAVQMEKSDRVRVWYWSREGWVSQPGVGSCRRDRTPPEVARSLTRSLAHSLTLMTSGLYCSIFVLGLDADAHFRSYGG